jgi:hypothetical protein
MVETRALSPHLGVEVTAPQRATTLTARDAAMAGGQTVSSQRTQHRTTVHGEEAFA